MNTKNIIPEVLNDFNVYKSGNRLIGVSGEVTLAEFQAMTETISGPGILGEIETSVIGHFQSMKQEVPFRMLDEDIFSLANPREVIELTLRGSQQVTEQSTGNVKARGMRVVFRGRPAGFNPGTLQQGKQMNATTTLELVYILIEIDGERKLELDKLNSVYKINDVDLLSDIKRQC